jgi:hypothetical protein
MTKARTRRVPYTSTEQVCTVCAETAFCGSTIDAVAELVSRLMLIRLIITHVTTLVYTWRRLSQVHLSSAVR